MNDLLIDPILSCEEARALEAELLGGNEDNEWQAMNRVGEALGTACYVTCVSYERSRIVLEFLFLWVRGTMVVMHLLPLSVCSKQYPQLEMLFGHCVLGMNAVLYADERMRK